MRINTPYKNKVKCPLLKENLQYTPLAIKDFFRSLQAKMTRAPLWAKSIAVSFPIPVFAPVMITVLPINLFLQVQTPSVQAKYAFKIAMPKTTESPI